MRTLQTALILAAVVCTTACTELGYVPKKDYDAVQAKLRETENKLKEADKQIADFQAHRYSVFQQGGAYLAFGRGHRRNMGSGAVWNVSQRIDILD